ncbi:MAG: RICIN domain-containing protein [Phaeodactylibacter sp.]|nr:RICIN domain-containing protein [Phaeodactylibacter sp.]
MKTMYSISFSAALLAVVIFVCSAWRTSGPSPVAEGTYFLQARHSGKYISVKDAGQENGSILWQWDFHGKKQQQFEFKSAGSGYYYIKAMHSGKYVSIKNAGQENGATVWQWDFHGKAQQQFALEPAEGNAYYIKARHSGKYLSIKNADKENKAILWQWEFHGKAQQQFELVAALPNGGSSSGVSISVTTDYRPAIQGDKVGCGGGTFYDPIDGGTCWTCPDGYNRTVFSVKSDKACERAAFERFASATNHGRGSGLLGTDCAGGQFWDPNGNCYSCPSGYSRTAHPVTSDKACSQRVHADYKPAMKNDDAKKCEGDYFLDIGTGKCWTCPDGYKRTVLHPVNSDKACEKITVSGN